MVEFVNSFSGSLPLIDFAAETPPLVFIGFLAMAIGVGLFVWLRFRWLIIIVIVGVILFGTGSYKGLLPNESWQEAAIIGGIIALLIFGGALRTSGRVRMGAGPLLVILFVVALAVLYLLFNQEIEDVGGFWPYIREYLPPQLQGFIDRYTPSK